MQQQNRQAEKKQMREELQQEAGLVRELQRRIREVEAAQRDRAGPPVRQESTDRLRQELRANGLLLE